MTAPNLHEILFHTQQAAQYFAMAFGSDRSDSVWLQLAKDELQKASELLTEFDKPADEPRPEAAE